MAGTRIIEHDGDLFYEPGANISDANTITITSDEILIPSGEASYTPQDYPTERLGPILQDRVNAIEVFLDQSVGHSYRSVSLVISDTAAETEDGEKLVRSLGSRQFVNSLPVLQRLGEIYLKRLRAALNTKAVSIHAGGTNFARMELRPNNRLTIEDATGADDFTGRIHRTTADENLIVTLELESDDGTIFGDAFFEPVALAEDLTPLDDAPGLLTGLDAEEISTILHDGTDQIYLRVFWDSVGWRTRVRWRIEAAAGENDNEWNYTETRGNFSLISAMVGNTYEYQAQHFSFASGQTSEWVNNPPDTLEIGGDADAPDDPLDLRVTPTVGGYELDWTPSTAEDYAFVCCL